jgi:lambda family phage portal protein
VLNWWETPLGQKRVEELAVARGKQQRNVTNGRTSAFARRQYAAARNTRFTAGWGNSDTSADAELVTSLTQMRARSRALVRDASYAKRAKTVIVNNVIGSGIGMQAQVMSSRGKLNDRVNEEIEEMWEWWTEAENCHTGGRLAFPSIERANMGQTFEAGEVYIRLHMQPFGGMGFPLALELIEAERLADDLSMGTPGLAPGNHYRLGVECDQYYRPVAYYIRTRHRGELRFSDYGPTGIERVPASQIIPLAVIDRWPQTRGEPWMHPAALRLNDMDGYSEAEIERARSQAVRMGIIETPEDADSYAEQMPDGSFEMELAPGVVEKLGPGEKWIDSSPSAPNPQLDPFMRYMLREVAAGVGLSYESISRDYSKSNYSSSRLALLEDRDLWRFYQSWFIRDFRKKVHRIWLQQAVFGGFIKSISMVEYANNPAKFESVLFKPRGWSWIDPTSEVEAYTEAVKQGFTTLTDVIAQTANGADIEDVIRVRARELEMIRAAGLVFETSPEIYTASANKAIAEAEAAASKDPPDKQDPPPDNPEGGDGEADRSAPPRAGRGVLEVVK